MLNVRFGLDESQLWVGCFPEAPWLALTEVGRTAVRWQPYEQGRRRP